MAVVQIQATVTCAGGDHVTISARLDGGTPQVTIFTVEQMTEALTAQDVAATILPLIRLHARGKTVAQLRTDLTAGISVTV